MLVSEIVAKPKNNHLNDVVLSESELNELTESIRQEGIRIPLIVQKKTGILIDGYNRLAIAKKLKMEEVPVEVQDIPDEDIEITQYLLQVGRRNIGGADRKMIIGRLINLKKMRAEDAEKFGVKKGMAKFAAKVDKMMTDSEGKLTATEAKKLVKVKGIKEASKVAKEIKSSGKAAKEVIKEAVKEKKTKMTPQQILEKPMQAFENAFDEYPQYEKEFRKILKSFLENI